MQGSTPPPPTGSNDQTLDFMPLSMYIFSVVCVWTSPILLMHDFKIGCLIFFHHKARITPYFCVSKSFANRRKLEDILIGVQNAVLNERDVTSYCTRGKKSNFIPPVTYLQRSTNAEQPCSMFPIISTFTSFYR